MFWKTKTHHADETVVALVRSNHQVCFPELFRSVNLLVGEVYAQDRDARVEKVVTLGRAMYWLNTLYAALCMQWCQDAGVRSSSLDVAIDQTAQGELAVLMPPPLRGSMQMMLRNRADDVNRLLSEASGRDIVDAQLTQVAVVMQELFGPDVVEAGRINLSSTAQAFAEALLPLRDAFRKGLRV